MEARASIAPARESCRSPLASWPDSVTLIEPDGDEVGYESWNTASQVTRNTSIAASPPDLLHRHAAESRTRREKPFAICGFAKRNAGTPGLARLLCRGGKGIAKSARIRRKTWKMHAYSPQSGASTGTN